MTTLPALAAARRHPIVAFLVAGCAAGVLVLSIGAGTLGKAAAYLSAMAASIVAVDGIAEAARLRARRNDAAAAADGSRSDLFPVRRPVLESALALGFFWIGCAFLWARFAPPPGSAALRAFTDPTRPGAKLGVILFVLPMGIALALLLLGYRPRDLGFRLRGLASAPIVVALVAAAAYASDPAGSRWGEVFAMGAGSGLQVVLLEGLLGAALVEETWRVVLQTRVGALLRNPAAGWLAATLLWAVLHVPRWTFEADGDALPALAGALRIVPIGLLWGYLTHRTGSVVPALLAHGTNLFGLQNFDLA